MNIAVIYKSRYGATKQYAEWIATALHADLLEHDEADAKTFANHDCVVYGGGLYAGGILGIDLMRKFPAKRLVLFTVGLANPKTADYRGIVRKNLTGPLAGAPIFHLRGGIDYHRLGTLHRVLMAILKCLLWWKPASARTADEKELLATYGQAVDFADCSAIAPLVEHVRGGFTTNTE